MSYSVVYQPKALQEFEDAALWYLERSKKASFNFYIAVKKKLTASLPTQLYTKKPKRSSEKRLFVTTHSLSFL